MASYNYVDTPNSNLLCCICHMPFTEPTTTRACFHTFCKWCINRAIAHLPQCPIDRLPLGSDDLFPANPIVRALVDELVVECPHRSSGCTITCQRQLLASHLKDACLYARDSYSAKDCSQGMSKDGIQRHRHNCPNHSDECGSENEATHNAECSECTAACPSCSSILPATSLSEHAATCPDVTVTCLHSSNGCQWTGPRHALSPGHLSSCPYESIKDFFLLNSSRVSALTAENILLKHRVEILEGLAHTLNREMQSVKIALGPWYKPDGENRPSIPPESQLGTRAFSSQPHGMREAASISPMPTVSQEGITPIVSAAIADPDILAPYFPPPTDPSSSRQSDQQRLRELRSRHRHSASISHFSDLGAAYPLPSVHRINFARPIAQSHASIAPINLGTTLEGSMRSLRESIVTLSASVDSIARQHDLALTNETLKLNEEVMNLKASIHGVRMQVHAIMMDRSAQVTSRMNEPPLIWGEPRDSAVWSTPISPRFHPHLPQTSPSVTKL